MDLDPTNSPGLCPGRVRSSGAKLQSKPTQTAISAISEQFFETSARGGCQGAPGHGHRGLFESRGHLFFGAIFGTFLTQIWC